MNLRRRTTTIIAALSLAAVLAACSGGATPTPQEDAETASCAAIQTFSDELRALYSLDPASASIEDYQAQRDVVTDSWDAVKASLEGVEAADAAAVEAGKAAVETAIASFPTDAPVADAIEGVKTASDPMRAAYLEMADGLGCAIATPF
jgi:hypothetical protein